MAREYAVIGAGQLGTALALDLVRQGLSVLVIDRDASRIQELATEVEAAVVADSTEERVLRELGVDRMLAAVVTIGAESIEASILTTALLKQLGVPRILARAATRLHDRVLRAVGAHEVIDPESEMGRRMALRLVQPTIKEQLEIGDTRLAEIEIPVQFVGKTLRELDVRNRFGASVVAVRRGDQVSANPAPGEPLQAGDILLSLGSSEAIARLAELV